MEKISKKQPRTNVERKEIRFSGMDAAIEGTDVIIRVPIIKIEKFDGPIFESDFIQYCRQHGVNDNVIEDIVCNFYDEIEKRSIADYLMEHMR